MILLDQPRGHYRFLSGIAPYSSGVTALAGYEIVHATLRRSLPYRQGFERIAHHFRQVGRDREALCAVELRLPAPLSFDEFAGFNREYQQLLDSWGLLLDGHNPIARTNIAPALRPPEQPSLYGFAYTVPAEMDDVPPTFIVAGAGDLNDQADLSTEAIIRPNETSDSALRQKARAVMDVMQTRLDGLQVGWSSATTVNIYTTQPLHSFLAKTVVDQAEAAAVHGVHWHLSRPPIAGLAYEMDVRGVRQELWLDTATE